MKKTLFVILVVSVLLTACSAGGQKVEPTPLPPEMEWEDVVSLLKTGEVEAVIQQHDLTVFLTMKDGQKTKTVEPGIDMIFAEIQNCGAPCSNIMLVTE